MGGQAGRQVGSWGRMGTSRAVTGRLTSPAIICPLLRCGDVFILVADCNSNCNEVVINGLSINEPGFQDGTGRNTDKRCVKHCLVGCRCRCGDHYSAISCRRTGHERRCHCWCLASCDRGGEGGKRGTGIRGLF